MKDDINVIYNCQFIELKFPFFSNLQDLICCILTKLSVIIDSIDNGGVFIFILTYL